MPATFYETIDVGEKLDWTFGWDDNDWLGADTIASSTWSVAPSLGISLTGAAFTTTTTSAFFEPTSAGTYRAINAVITAGGRKGIKHLLLFAEDVAALNGYLSTNDAEARLWSRYGVEASLSTGDLEAASVELDALAPFIGSKYDTSGDQELAFPRSINPDGTEGDGEVPERVLDWVALAAYTITSPDSPAVTSESIGSTSRTYSTSRVSPSTRRLAHLIEPYFLKVGQRVGAYDTWRTHESYPDYPIG